MATEFTLKNEHLLLLKADCWDCGACNLDKVAKIIKYKKKNNCTEYGWNEESIEYLHNMYLECIIAAKIILSIQSFRLGKYELQKKGWKFIKAEVPDKFILLTSSTPICKEINEEVIFRTVQYKNRPRTWCSKHTRGIKSLSRKGPNLCSGCKNKKKLEGTPIWKIFPEMAELTNPSNERSTITRETKIGTKIVSRGRPRKKTVKK
jgi:hypothetical protein